MRRCLIALADKYETDAFSMGDPSRVLRQYASPQDAECAAFVMASLSFGRREQFLPKAEGLLSKSGGHPAEWIASGAWQGDCPQLSKKFYRFYSYDDMRDLLGRLQSIMNGHGSLGEAVRRGCVDTGADAAFVISGLFAGVRAVSHSKASPAKRTRMFLRWMVRRGSPVDLGLWTWLKPSDLIIPLDTHVLQSAKTLGLLDAGARATGKTALALTEMLKEVWPLDPCKGDFALFGWGVEANKAKAFLQRT